MSTYMAITVLLGTVGALVLIWIIGGDVDQEIPDYEQDKEWWK